MEYNYRCIHFENTNRVFALLLIELFMEKEVSLYVCNHQYTVKSAKRKKS